MGGKRESVVVQHLRSARDTDVAGDGARRSSGVASVRSRVALLVLATLLVFAMPVLALAAESPHGAYDPTVDPDDLDVTTDKCSQCHKPHQASVSQDLLSVEPTTGVVTQTVLCFKCHGYAGPAESNAQATFETALPTGHRVEDSTGTPEPDLTNVCADCHEPHGEDAGLPRADINGFVVDRENDPNSWCEACHDPDAFDRPVWSGDATGTAYYDQIFTSRDASSYPTFGTFRGWNAYETNSAHSSIPASASVVIQGSPERTAERGVGDCLWCHASHRAPSEYDNLVGEFGPSSPGDHGADVCFVSGACHDISGGYGSGHLISTPTATLAVGSPLPCYECHNAHGSKNGNAMLGQDTLGQNLDPSTPEGEAAFCYTCHLSSDSYGWNSFSSPAAMEHWTTLTSQSGITTSVVGIPRADMAIPVSVSAHASANYAGGCFCHGSVHAPNPDGVSAGGVACYECHSSYEDPMEAGGLDSTDWYHHVMGTGTGDGDTAFASGSYPTSTTDVYCMSCHADHDQFNSEQAANLRLDLTSAATTSATDYVATGTYGICVSCHSSSLTKDNTNQKPEVGATTTPKIVGGTGAGGFGLSAHNYTVQSTFGDSSTFDANCSKCHGDEQIKEFQTSDDTFGTHYSAARRLLSALGGTVTDPLAEEHCYGCHSESGDGRKTADGLDWYGAEAMSAASEDVYDQFQLAGSKHPVAASLSGSVECESCHNAHVVNSANVVSDPENTYDTALYVATAQQAGYCLTCHDTDGGPTRVVDGTTCVPYSVSLTAVGMDKSTYDTTGRTHWELTGSTDVAGGIPAVTGPVSCAVCHDNHGSRWTKLLGVRTATDNTINGQTITGNDNSVCYACHTGADTQWPTFDRESGASGYPVDGTWPGSTLYTSTTYGLHDQADVVWPGSGYTGGDCKNCHDVHGTANTYDELRGTFTASNYGTCFTCHDGSISTAPDVTGSYPTSAGGDLANTDDRAGHSGDLAGAGNPVVPTPCYNCHNPHGSYGRGRNDGTGNPTYPGLLVKTQIGAVTPTDAVFGDAAGEIDLSTDAGVRRFCFMCHLGNNGLGWNGSAYQAVASGAQVDGFDRNTQLRVTMGGGGHATTGNNSCLNSTCHPDVHNPD